MSIASLHRKCRPVGVLLGGSGISQITLRTQPDVGALLKPRIDHDGWRSMPITFVSPPWEVAHHDFDLYRKRVSALVDEAAKDDPQLVLEMIGQ